MTIYLSLICVISILVVYCTTQSLSGTIILCQSPSYVMNWDIYFQGTGPGGYDPTISTINVSLHYQSNAWIGIGLHRQGFESNATYNQHFDADMIATLFLGTNSFVNDTWAGFQNFPAAPEDDITLGGVDNILEYTATQNSTGTYATFSRYLVTNDIYDWPILPGDNILMWGYGHANFFWFSCYGWLLKLYFYKWNRNYNNHNRNYNNHNRNYNNHNRYNHKNWINNR